MALITEHQQHGNHHFNRVSNASVFGAGVAGAVVVVLILTVARAIGITSFNISMIIGSIFTQALTDTTWFIGFAIHLLLGGVVALMYASAFRKLSESGATPGAGAGAAFGVVHWMIGGILIGLVGLIHPLMPESLPSPGFFAVSYGLISMVVIFIAHMVYGAVVGSIYRHESLKREDTTTSIGDKSEQHPYRDHRHPRAM